jgi:ferredoxin
MADNRSPKHILRLVQPSTRAFIQTGRRTPGYTFLDWLHGYIYARWPYLYIGIGTGEHPLAQRLRPVIAAISRLFSSQSTSQPREARQPSASLATHTYADGYHGKVVPLDAATQLVTVNEPIRLPNLEQVIPYVRARDLILQNPDHIIALDCPCRTSRENPCLPLDVCLIVGEPFASFVAEHHPQRSRWITSHEAVEILKAEDARGHVHHAFFKDAMLGRFYAICNCCSCCCGAMQAHQRGTPMLVSSGYVSQVDETICIGCGDCAETCQFEAITVNHSAHVDSHACMGCGICLAHCAQDAISLVRDPAKSAPLEIFSLMEQC